MNEDFLLQSVIPNLPVPMAIGGFGICKGDAEINSA
jgi:hypothetical protein